MAGTQQESSLRMRKVHRFLEAKPQFLWWEMDDLIVMTGPLVLGIMTEHVIIAAGLSAIVIKIYKKLKDESQEGFVKHFAYHHGLLKFKGMPDSWVKEMNE